MGQVHHGSATTTAAVRRAIQHSEASLRTLAARYGINPKTVAKWRKRSSTADRRTGPTELRSTVLSVDDEAVVVAFRRHTLLPLGAQALPRSSRRHQHSGAPEGSRRSAKRGTSRDATSARRSVARAAATAPMGEAQGMARDRYPL